MCIRDRDIYGEESKFIEGFKMYAQRIHSDGLLIRHASVELNGPRTLTYAVDKDADFTGSNLRIQDGSFLMDLSKQNENWTDLELGLPGRHNAENALACIAMALELGLNESEIRLGLKSFKGVKRRFEYHKRESSCVYVDDYAHHPTEIDALIESIRLMYPGRKVTGVFQPHLYSRTRDFFDEFAASLSKLDELVLLPIYPARELPIEGVTSAALIEKVSLSNKKLMERDAAVSFVTTPRREVLLTIGAGDIDRIVPQISSKLDS